MALILVVDDSAVDRLLVGGLIEKHAGFHVEYARHGGEAIQHIQRSVPDLVLTDMIMPEMDGLQLVTQLRHTYPLVPTVLMTSQGNEEVAVQALKRGAASYVPKKALANNLIDTIRDVLNVSGQERRHMRLMSCVASSEQSFVLDNDRSLLSSLVNFLQDSVTQMGVCDETDRMRVGIALEEALVNALYHGNLEVSSELREFNHAAYEALINERLSLAPYKNRKVRVEARLSHDRASFIVRDEGPGFDLSALPDPTDPANLERVSGRGVLLMRTFMDKVSYNEDGNQVELVKLGKSQQACNEGTSR